MQIRLMVLDPGHFHASLVQKEMYTELARRVSVYAPLGNEVLDYLNRVRAFNARRDDPTNWEIDLHTGADFVERMIEERPGNVVVLSGRNRPKIDRIEAAVKAGLHVLADKPWIVSPADFPKLVSLLNEAEKRDIAAYDIMTERFEITSILQRELVNDEGVFGKLLDGRDTEPAVTARSVHHLMKMVAGAPIRRPAWFFDVNEYGEGLADVGTHVVDLVQWTAFPDQVLDYRNDIRLLAAEHWPTILSQTQFERVTGEREFPQSVAAQVKVGKLEYFCNNSVDYTLRGVHVRLSILWEWEAPEGTGDSYEATFRGSKSRIELRQGREERFVPELYIVAESSPHEVFEKLRRKVSALNATYEGLAVEMAAGEAHLVIPERYRVGHEAHFAQVTRQFLEYVKAPRTMPAWEKANMLAKYFVTVKGVELASASAMSVAGD
ncbi:MAG TPA: putative oxidoreductase C-terminal domain-containing protein [Bryobacteraceae bacterium]